MEFSQLDVIAGDFDIVDYLCPHRFVHVRYALEPEPAVEGVYCVACGEPVSTVKATIAPKPAQVPFRVAFAWALAGRLLHSSRGKESEGRATAEASSQAEPAGQLERLDSWIRETAEAIGTVDDYGPGQEFDSAVDRILYQFIPDYSRQ